MAPPPSPNACGLAAYRQLAGNLRVTGIDHGYWTSRKGNATRFALWHERRAHAAPYLRALAATQGPAREVALKRAATAFEAETAVLARLTKLLPPGGDEKAHWEEATMARAESMLKEALVLHQEGIAVLRTVAGVEFEELETTDPDALQELVAHKNVLVADAALARLVALAPDDLDRRLAALWESEPDAQKEMADGPIHRQLLYALDQLDSDVATDAIGRAILFEGKADAVNSAISKWAAEMYWKRKGAAGKAVFLNALDSKTQHVQDHALKYLGKTGDASLLPRLQKMERPAAYHARILLGDDSAYPPLIEVLRTPGWYSGYAPLRELGARTEPHALRFLDDGDEPFVMYVAALLSRIGTKKSLPALEKTVAKYPNNKRIRQALDDLKKRLP